MEQSPFISVADRGNVNVGLQLHEVGEEAAVVHNITLAISHMHHMEHLEEVGRRFARCASDGFLNVCWLSWLHLFRGVVREGTGDYRCCSQVHS